jgi:hypothetical protein
MVPRRGRGYYPLISLSRTVARAKSVGARKLAPKREGEVKYLVESGKYQTNFVNVSPFGLAAAMSRWSATVQDRMRGG